MSHHLGVRFRRLAESDPSTWDSLRQRFAEAGAVVLDGPVTDGEVLLASLGVSDHSTLGALVANCGGVVIDHGWLRMFAGGSAAMPSLLEANRGTDHAIVDHLVVAFDILGGRFAINGNSDRAAPGEVCYFAPDTLEWFNLEWFNLEWFNLEMGHTEFVHWALGVNLEQFYRDFRWPGWEHRSRRTRLRSRTRHLPPTLRS